MANEKMRTFEFGGKKRGVRLDQATWQAVDWLSEQRGMKWAALAHEWAMLADHSKQITGKEGGDNLTGVIRTYAMHELLKETILNDRAQTLSGAGPIWQSLGMASDDNFQYALDQATRIEGEDDFVGFKLTAGVSEFGKVTFYIENAIKGCPSLIISTPFTPEQWEGAQ